MNTEDGERKVCIATERLDLFRKGELSVDERDEDGFNEMTQKSN
jgi:hypothetical protein